ncbi:MAG TPA: hypothetical protein VFH38_06380 [Jatrophihabitans sp.]|nr:hypothetical protein [Jatrophihabitans sp.]
MDAPPILRRHRSLRWLAPTAVVAAIAVVGLYAGGLFRANASAERLPPVTPEALIADVHAAGVTGFSGTAVSHMSLGLPALPSFGAAEDNTTLLSLLSGSHTLQVWYGGEDKQRIAILGATDETDLFRDGQNVWKWSSADRVAMHAVLPEHSRGDRGARTLPAPMSTLPATPQSLSREVLTALGGDTRVAVREGGQVAHRPTYDLVLKPRTDSSLIGSVQVAVDAATKLPLAVRVYPRGATTPAVDVAYTSIRFATPADTVFSFSPPAGATVRQWRGLIGDSTTSAAGPQWRLLNSGWSTVVDYRPARPVHLGSGLLAQALTPVAGSWGSGRLLQTSLLNVLFTKSGRILAGAVDPGVLYAAAATTATTATK